MLPQVCLFFYAIGIVFTLILFPILFSRIFFIAALPDALKPTLMILIGPLALAFSGYIGFTGHVDMASSIMYYFNLFLFIVLVSKLYSLPLKTPFRLSWWAVGFPLAAFTIATINFAFFSQTILFNAIAMVLLAGTTGIVLYLLVRTLVRLYGGSWEIQQQSPEPTTMVSTSTFEATHVQE
jgi:tellurite resistance protein